MKKRFTQLLSKECLFNPVGWAIAFIVLLSFFLRYHYNLLHTSVDRDEIYYLERALSFASTGDPELLKQQPFLPIYLLSLLLKTLDIVNIQTASQAARIWAAAIGSLGIIPSYFIGKMLFKQRRYGFLLLGISAIHPTLVSYGGVFLRESYTVALIPLTLYGLLKLLDQAALPTALWVGALIGIGSNCRLEYPEFFIYALLAIFMSCRKPVPKKQIIKAIAALSATFILFYVFLPLIPGLGINYNVTKYIRALIYYCKC